MSFPTKTIASSLSLYFALQAVPASRFALTVDNIMRGPNLIGYEPTQIRWSGDNQKLYFQWKQASDPLDKNMDTWVANRDGSGLRKLTDEEEKLAPPFVSDFTEDRREAVYARNGDLFIYTPATGKIRQITKTVDSETNPHFTKDGKQISFTRANNLYLMSLEDGSLTELTDIQIGGAAAAPTAPAAGRGGGGGRGQGQGRGGAAEQTAQASDEQKGTDSQEFVKKEERDLLDVVKERAAKREEDAAKRKKEETRKPFRLQAQQSVAALQLSPDGKYVVASVAERATRGKNTVVPNFVTESGYTEDIPSRDKVGDQQTQVRLALINVETGDQKWIDAGQKKGDAPRQVQLTQPTWSEDGTKAVLSARATDNKDRWILALDPATGKTRVLATIHDDAWVGGPGANVLGWIKSDRVYFQSEKTGFSHLYTVAWDGGEPRALTSGNWEVMTVTLSRDKSKFFLTTSESDLGEHQLYQMSVDGGARTRITSLPGHHTPVVSPDEQWIADIYSYTNKPPDLYVQANRPDAKEQRITTSPSAEFSEYHWMDVPIVTFPARDGATLRAKLYKPANFRKGGPAVVFVHGSGYLQDIHKGWSGSYYHEYMFNQILMEHGFLVLEIDYRGSAGLGRDWRTGIYEHMGGKDLDDHVDAVKWLVAQHGVDPKKIGLYGGSYGGFITLMAMFTQPDVFAAGAALRPVTDWAHYNHPYTSNILNNPQSDPEAYRRSSPIYFANGLKGALLICHGMVDTNVHFQDTVRLVQKLIELRKENWDVAMYPVENHGFVEPTSWADEYKRILALFERTLKGSTNKVS